jgi:H+/Cl- antiporter ClcA
MRLLVRYETEVFQTILRSPQLRALVFVSFMILALGTVFYHLVEGWSWLDSAYFSTVTLATVGYGDFAPKTDAGKLFTIPYVIFGAGIIAGLILVMARAPLFHNQLPTAEKQLLPRAPEPRVEDVP